MTERIVLVLAEGSTDEQLELAKLQIAAIGNDDIIEVISHGENEMRMHTGALALAAMCMPSNKIYAMPQHPSDLHAPQQIKHSRFDTRGGWIRHKRKNKVARSTGGRKK